MIDRLRSCARFGICKQIYSLFLLLLVYVLFAFVLSRSNFTSGIV